MGKEEPPVFRYLVLSDKMLEKFKDETRLEYLATLTKKQKQKVFVEWIKTGKVKVGS